MKLLIKTQLIDRTNPNPNHNVETFFFDDLNAQTMEELGKIIDLQNSMIELSASTGARKSRRLQSASMMYQITRGLARTRC